MEQPAKPPPARRAARGGLAIAAAKVYFMVVGLGQQIALKHLLGLDAYGALGRVQGAASIVYNPIVATGIQGVSRAVSGAGQDHPAVQRAAVRFHAAAAVPIAALFAVGAPWIADAMQAPHLTTGLRIAAIILFAYGLYAPVVGALNGRRHFGAQAGLDVVAATLRTIGLLGGAWFWSGYQGALGGFAGAACFMVAIAVTVLRREPSARGVNTPFSRTHLAFVAPLFFAQFGVNLLLQSDLQLLGGFAAVAAESAGLPAAAADRLAGGYRNAQLFCFLPYQLLFAINFVLFPMLAQAAAEGQREAVANLVRSGVRLAALLTGAMVAVTASIPSALLHLVFGADSAALGADGMRRLAVGLGFFALFGVFTTVLTSLGRERLTALLTGVALVFVVATGSAVLVDAPFGAELITRTASATAVALGGATVAAGWCVHRTAGATLAATTLVRTSLGVGVAVAVGQFLPAGGRWTAIPYAALLALVYALVLIVSRELDGDDWRRLRSLSR